MSVFQAILPLSIQLSNFNTQQPFYSLIIINLLLQSIIIIFIIVLRSSLYPLNKTLFIYFGVALFEQDPIKCKKKSIIFILYGDQLQKYHPKINEQSIFWKIDSYKNYYYNTLRNKKFTEC